MELRDGNYELFKGLYLCPFCLWVGMVALDIHISQALYCYFFYIQNYQFKRIFSTILLNTYCSCLFLLDLLSTRQEWLVILLITGQFGKRKFFYGGGIRITTPLYGPQLSQTILRGPREMLLGQLT